MGTVKIGNCGDVLEIETKMQREIPFIRGHRAAREICRFIYFHSFAEAREEG